MSDQVKDHPLSDWLVLCCIQLDRAKDRLWQIAGGIANDLRVEGVKNSLPCDSRNGIAVFLDARSSCDSEFILGDEELRLTNIIASPFGVIDFRITIDTRYLGSVRLRSGRCVCFGGTNLRPDTKFNHLFEWIKHGTNATVQGLRDDT